MNKETKNILIGAGLIIASPILNEIVELVCTGIETLKVGMSKKIVAGNIEIEEMSMGQEETNSVAYGFQYDENEDEYYDDYEEYEDDDEYEEDNIKMGFRA